MYSIIMSFMTVDLVARLVRTALQTGGAALVTKGLMSGSDMEAIIGATVALVTTVYTVLASKKATTDPRLGGLH